MSDEVEPIQPITRATPVAPTTPVSPATPAAPVNPPSGVAPAPGDATVGDAAMREELEHPIRVPGDRAQQLAGAAASAGSGQAAVVRLEPADPEVADPGDPLAPITAIDEDPLRRDPRPSEEQQADGDLGT